jgi:hypothetical protein
VADPDRKGGGGLSLRTLVIASAASLSAAMVSSRLFPPGTIYASALTPVIVAAVSEMLNRPAERVSQLRTQRRTLVHEAARAPQGEEAAALRGAPGFAHGGAADDELGGNGNGNGNGSTPPIRIHGRRPRLLHPKVWLVTGLVAFMVAAAALTLPELIFGGALASQHRTTYFGGGSSSATTGTTKTPTKTTTQPQQTVTQTVPAQTPSSTQTTPTATQPTTTETSTQPAPASGGTPPPSDTSTQPAPSGTAPASP